MGVLQRNTPFQTKKENVGGRLGSRLLQKNVHKLGRDIMRKLLYFTLGFGTGCGLCAYLLPIETIFPVLSLSLAFGLGFLIFSGKNKTIARIALIALGCGAALCWYRQYDDLYLRHAAALDGKIQTASISVSDFSYETSYGIAFDGTITLNGKPYQVKAYLNDLEGVEPGELVTGDFRFRLTTPDGEEASPYHPGKGIFLLAYQRGDVTVSRTEETWLDAVSRLRLDIRQKLQALFPEDAYPFALALLLGDGGELDYAADTAFKLSGIRHIIAVSGQHVVLVFSLISLLTFRKRCLTALVGFPALILFAALAGFTPSVVRACLMSGLMLLALVLNREYDGATGLSFACLVMLTANPLVITSVSFQLSAGSVAGIYLFQPRIQQWMRSRFPVDKVGSFWGTAIGAFASSTAVTLSAMIVTTPLCALHFGTISLVSVVTNLLTLWVVSFVFYGILAVCLLSLFSMSLAGWIARLISWPIRYILLVAKTLAEFPLAAVYTQSVYIALWLVFVYLLLGVFLLQKQKKPGVLLCCGVIGLCISLLASWAEPMQDQVRFTVLDVGQGQCLLLQYEDQTYMVDCGGDSDTAAADIAAEALLSQGITELDGLILTHLDRDHAGGVEHLLSRVDTRLLILPPVASQLPKAADGAVIYAAEDLTLSCGDMKLKIFTPNFPGNSNEMSLCILFDTEKCDILITGDRNGFGERSLLRYEDIPDVDILVAGHHGSQNSTCMELLQAVQPEIVCISVGQGNSYGHPAPELLQRLQDFGCRVYRTDLNGEICYRVSAVFRRARHP